MTDRYPVMVLGGSGYVAGELLRLIAAHPRLDLAGVLSESRAGQAVGSVFGHLVRCYAGVEFDAPDRMPSLLQRHPRLGVFAAAPHGATAGLLANLLEEAASAGCEVQIVDTSADFRFSSADAYAAVYGHAHGAPAVLGRFLCAVPEQHPQRAPAHVAHPGCFATAMLLSAVPLIAESLVEADLFVSAVTGSTGSGRTPAVTTHHPERHSNLFAYKPLEHRHAPEVMALIRQATGQSAQLHFVPHSGPFARGIEATLQARLRRPASAADLRELYRDYYREAPFVNVVEGLPRMKDVVGSNDALLGVAADGDTLAVSSVIDNLVKGAAGGAVQWMNRQCGWPDETGLTACAAGWT